MEFVQHVNVYFLVPPFQGFKKNSLWEVCHLCVVVVLLLLLEKQRFYFHRSNSVLPPQLKKDM